MITVGVWSAIAAGQNLLILEVKAMRDYKPKKLTKREALRKIMFELKRQNIKHCFIKEMMLPVGEEKCCYFYAEENGRILEQVEMVEFAYVKGVKK